MLSPAAGRIFLNPTIERLPKVNDFERRALTFTPHTPAELLGMDIPQLEAKLGELQAITPPRMRHPFT